MLRIVALLTTLALALPAPWALAAERGDVVLRGGAIYTLDPSRPWAVALVIRDGRIAYVGDDAGAKEHADRGARVIDLQGRMVLPGFHDAHLHPMTGAMRLLRCRFSDLTTAEQLYGAVRLCAAKEPKKAWVIGTGWSPQAFGPEGPSRARLDELVPDRPAYLTTEDGFTAWVNSKALAMAGIAADGPAVLEGKTLERVRRLIPPPSEAEYREALRRSTSMLNRFGVTSVFDASATEPVLRAYRAADKAGELTVRVVAAQRVDTARGPEQVDEFIRRRDELRGQRFRADAAKIFVDVEIDQHSAALLAPYADQPGTSGELLVQPAVLSALVRRLDIEGFLVHMHVMGDSAVRTGLDAIEGAMKANGARDRRHQLAHNGVVHPDDLPRFARLGVAANFTPIWAQADDPVMTANEVALGAARSRWILPMGSIAAAGGKITAGSDWPSPSMNPLDGIQVAVTRQPLDGGKPAKQPQEVVRLATILAAYTRDAAWAAREDTIDGSIEVGKAADLIVLDRNLFEVDTAALHKVHVLLTLLDGEPVYRDASFSWP